MKALTDSGVPEDDAERALEARRPKADRPAFEVWEENIEAFEIFCALGTQWHRVSGLGGVAATGLMYSEATSYMRERGLARKRRLELLEDLRVMERASIRTWNAAANG